MNSKRKVLKTILKVLTSVLSFSALIVLTSCQAMGAFSNNNNQSSTQSQGMETYTVMRGNILQEATTTGSVDVKTTNTYTFEVTGKVISALEQGKTFKKGDILIELDNSEGVDKINDLEDSLQTAEDSLGTSKSSLTTAKINYQQALDSNHIAIQLADINTISSEQASQNALTSLENANSAADASINSANISLENAAAAADASLNSANISTENAAAAADASLKSAQIALNIAQDSYNAVISDPTSTQSAINTASDKLRTAQATYNQAAVAVQNSTSSVQASSVQTEESAQSQVDSAQAAYEQAKASAQSQADSAEAAYEQALNSQSASYWNNLSSLQSAQAQIKLTRVNISDAGLKLKQAERSVESFKQDIEDAKQDLNDFKILAPYDGIISSTGYKVGEKSSQGATGISIISNEFIIKATISENDMPKVKVGNEVVISLDAYSDVELNGTLEKINPVSTTTDGIVSYEVLISFQDVKDVELFYGLSANLTINTAKAENVLYVPLQSVYKENGKSYVDVLKTAQANQTNKSTQAQTIEKVEVTTGLNDYINIEIKSGISQGDIIVTSKVTQ